MSEVTVTNTPALLTASNQRFSTGEDLVLYVERTMLPFKGIIWHGKNSKIDGNNLN